jgi:hypothetical protein
MRVATFRGERNLADLVDRLFEIKGPKAKERAREVQAALLEANPHLHDLKKVSEGTVILVPEVAGVAPVETLPSLQSGVEELAEGLRRALVAVRAALAAAATAQAAEMRDTLEFLKTKEVKALSKADPALETRLARVASESTARLKEAEALKTVHQQAVSDLQKDLGDMLGRATG